MGVHMINEQHLIKITTCQKQWCYNWKICTLHSHDFMGNIGLVIRTTLSLESNQDTIVSIMNNADNIYPPWPAEQKAAI